MDRIKYIRPEDIPDIDLYMDQVTTFMDEELRQTTRHPGEDKILTKTMINNYAKNKLLPPPVKKKYTKEHMLLLIFIYYYKNVLSIGDIQALLNPITEKYFGKEGDNHLESVYREVFSMEKLEIDRIKQDVKEQYRISHDTFQDADESDAEFLKSFSFICMLSFDVYVKKLLIEKLIDGLNKDYGEDSTKKKSAKSKK